MLVGQFLSFGIGGADRASYCLTKGLVEVGIDVKVFYSDYSFPKGSSQVRGPILSRYDQISSLGVPMIKINDASELNNHGLSLLNTHRSGDDLWLIQNLENITTDFKIVETNFHGNLKTKADIRVFPSYEMIKTRSISVPYTVIPNPIMCKLTDDDFRSEFNLDGKFVFGSFGRPGADIYSYTALGAFKLIENADNYFLYIAPHSLVTNAVDRLGLRNLKFIDATLDDLILDKLYNTIDVLCHSNGLGETFGNTIAEAMIHSKPVVSHLGSDWPQAQKELLRKYSETYVCADDINVYSKRMSNLMNDEQAYIDYSKYVKDKADRLYDYRIVTQKYIDLYNNL